MSPGRRASAGSAPGRPTVCRAPLRSRDDTIPARRTLRRALEQGVVGFGDAATDRDQRWARRVERFSELPAGTLVWTRREAGDADTAAFLLGRLDAGYREDRSAAAVAADLVHVRDCDWLTQAVDPGLVPTQVRQAFARGGRNLQRIGVAGVAEATARVWQLLA